MKKNLFLNFAYQLIEKYFAYLPYNKDTEGGQSRKLWLLDLEFLEMELLEIVLIELESLLVLLDIDLEFPVLELVEFMRLELLSFVHFLLILHLIYMEMLELPSLS